MLQTTLQSLKAKKNSKKGFTLMEMLIVVAIIGVLVAISIPVFTSKLDDAKQAADDANMRTAKAVYAVYMLDASGTESGITGNGTYYFNASTGKFEKNDATGRAPYEAQSDDTAASPTRAKGNYIKVVIGTTNTAPTWAAP